MALETWYDAGTVSVANGSTTVTASNAFWGGDAIMPGDLFCDPAQPLVPPQRVMSVTNDTTLELWAPWPGTAMTDDPYEIRYVGIIERSTAQTRKVLEQMGEVSAYFDVQVDTLADRAAFDARPANYRVLVSDVGDGTAQIFSKASSVDADWSDGAMLGAVGPAGPTGVNWRGAWDSGTVYAALDGVLYNGSSWRAKQASTNQAPPALPTVENTYWHLVAQKGVDGSGTGDVVGPSSSVSGRIALFSGTTGKVLDQAGLTIADLEPARTLVTQAEAEAGTATTVRAWTAQRIAQAIAARSGIVDLEITVSQLALALADANNVAQFLGSTGNRVADSFDALTYVDTAGASGLDTSVAGLLKPVQFIGGIDANTQLLLHGDGANGSTTFTDSSANAATITNAAAGSTISTAQSKFGGSSIYFNGAGYLSRADDASLELSNLSFTIDFWLRPDSVAAGTRSLLTKRVSSAGYGLSIAQSGSAISIYASSNGSAWDLLSNFGTAFTLAAGVWTHFALVRNGNTFTLYKDGVQVATTSTTSAFANNAAPYYIGGEPGGGTGLFAGFMDELRISVGVARWTANFTPPAAPYDANTPGSVENMTVRSAAFTASAPPPQMKALLNVREVDAATAGVDYTLECSRDGGTTFTLMALTEKYSQPGGLRVVEAAATDVSGQPSGSAPRWRFKTLNNKNVELHDVYLYWS